MKTELVSIDGVLFELRLPTEEQTIVIQTLARSKTLKGLLESINYTLRYSISYAHGFEFVGDTLNDESLVKLKTWEHFDILFDVLTSIITRERSRALDNPIVKIIKF